MFESPGESIARAFREVVEEFRTLPLLVRGFAVFVGVLALGGAFAYASGYY